MTKTEAKKLIKEYYKDMIDNLDEKIVDWDLWKDDGEFMYHIITVSRNHVPYKYSGYFIGDKIHPIYEGTGLLTIAR